MSVSAPAAVPTGTAEYLLVSVCLPGRPPENAGVLLLANGELHLRFRRDFIYWAGEEAEILEELEPDLRRKSEEIGPAALLAFLEDSLSHTLRLSARRSVLCLHPDATLRTLYAREIDPPVRRFQTHLPVYSFRAAATRFGPNVADEGLAAEEEWIEAPQHLRLDPNLFAIRILGRSMEPKVQDGELALFRANVSGSREGRLLAVQYRKGSDVQFTFKRYRSEKIVREDDWQHARIWLEPLNRDFDPILLEEGDDLRVIGEFVAVLPE
jgi:SOS-response transcriptional repressor LexA